MEEYLFAERVWPGIMPKSVNLGEFIQENPQLEEKRKRSAALLDAYLKTKNGATGWELRDSFVDLTQDIFVQINEKFPQGAFIKYIMEAQTGDTGDQIKTWSTLPKVLINQFMKNLNVAMMTLGSEELALGLKSEKFYEHFDEVDKAADYFFTSLALNPTHLMFQEKVDIDYEARVDVASGFGLKAQNRYDAVYDYEKNEMAKKIVDEFFDRTPEEDRILSAGFDSVILKGDGEALFDLNAGVNSAHIDPRFEPMAAYEFVSALSGFRAVYMLEMDAMSRAPLEDQKAHFAKIHGYQLLEEATWLRNRIMDEWRQDPTLENARTKLTKLKKLFSSFPQRSRKKTDALLFHSWNYVFKKIGQ